MPLVQNPNETRKPLKKALENWIKLAISQSGPAAMHKTKRTCALPRTHREKLCSGLFFAHPLRDFLKRAVV